MITRMTLLLLFFAALAAALAASTTVIALQADWRGTRGWLISWLFPVIALFSVVVALSFTLTRFTEWTGMPPQAGSEQTRIEYLEGAAKVVAFVAAALFILVKLAAGHGFSNATITTTMTRSPSPIDQTKDLVAVTTRITSAGARSFQLLDVGMFKVSSANAALERASSLPVSGFKKNFAVGSVIDEVESDRPLTLHPGDSIEVVGWTSVGRSEILPIKVVVLGLASTALAREQWVSAAVSIPDEPESKQEKSKTRSSQRTV